jgi:hypothetical protein
MRDPGNKHWPSCWKSRNHFGCAVERVEWLERELEQARETYGNCALQLAETQKDYAEYQSDTTRQILDLRERVGELEAEGRHDPRRLPARHLYLFTQEAVQKLIAAAKREGAHDELAEPAGMRERTRARTDGG